ncbi:MAG TPA: class I SAM-dependent methyltransferase [Thermoanaerobaculia bacterium]|nr:class I SAM-dependent methyltransferase [Thermoanaerobaculia bacterium]
MSSAEDRIRNISDTAIWAAMYRARENRRGDALFRDPFAERLAGERGERIAEQMRAHGEHEWAWVMRTVLYDRVIAGRIAAGADMVVNLAAGLDARPYRMALPPALQWVEVDLPDLVDYKERILAGDEPACRLERVRLDLADVAARRQLFASLGERSSNALVITEGLLIYLTADEVGALARDLAAARGFRHWVLEVVSPGLLRMLQREVGEALEEARAPLKFGPPEGPAFFMKHGWKPVSVESPLKAAARAKRLPFFLRLVAKLPESSGAQGNRPWSGICLLEKI